MNYDSMTHEETYRSACDAVRGGDTFEEWAADYGWADWMDSYTNAADGEICSEAEFAAIDKVMRNIWAQAVEDNPVYINELGETGDFNSAVRMMDDELREELHATLAPCSNQEFIEAYAKAHAEKFNEAFVPYIGGAL